MEFLKSRVYCTYNSNLQVGMRIQSNRLSWLSQLRTLFFQQSQCALKIPDQIVGEVSSKYLTSSTLIADHKGETSIQRVPALRGFWDLEKTVLHEIHVSRTVLWSPTNANSPTYTFVSQKRGSGNGVSDFC